MVLYDAQDRPDANGYPEPEYVFRASNSQCHNGYSVEGLCLVSRGGCLASLIVYELIAQATTVPIKVWMVPVGASGRVDRCL
jgi:hypothetical protein